MALPGEPIVTNWKPEKGSGFIARKQKRKDLVKAEDAAKAIVRADDKICRWPKCENCRAYKPPLEVAHVVRAKGMGGDHGTVSTPADMMLLDKLTHAQQETHRKDVVALTDRGTRGPCEFWATDENDRMYLVARESAPFIYERD
jgi:hypothetical protein